MDDEILGGKTVSERTGVPAAADRRLLAERLRYLVAGETGRTPGAIVTRLGHLRSAAKREERGR